MATKLSTVAERIAHSADIDYHVALTRATTHAAQIGYTGSFDLVEGGQAPDDEISDEHAGYIARMVHNETIVSGGETIDALADAVGRIEEATGDRNALIRKAIREGIPVRQIAGAAQLSRERIYQIRDGRR